MKTKGKASDRESLVFRAQPAESATKRIFVLSGCMLLGTAASAVLYFLAAIVFSGIISRSGRSPESLLWVAYLIVLPICLFLGSAVTGYLQHPRRARSPLSLLPIVPGVWLFALALPVMLVHAALPALAFLAIWAFASWGGVIMGSAMRR